MADSCDHLRAEIDALKSQLVERTPVYTNRLQCVECGRVSRENKRGGRAYRSRTTS
jgi:hypothetical protein